MEPETCKPAQGFYTREQVADRIAHMAKARDNLVILRAELRAATCDVPLRICTIDDVGRAVDYVTRVIDGINSDIDMFLGLESEESANPEATLGHKRHRALKAIASATDINIVAKCDPVDAGASDGFKIYEPGKITYEIVADVVP
jgi:hypothetical protein